MDSTAIAPDAGEEAPAGQRGTRRLVHALREFAADARTLPILTQDEPDPDALASAFAVRALLHRPEKTTPIVALGEIRRPETRRMAELLGLHSTRVTETELRAFERVVAVDLEPIVLRGADTRVAVIDHHPSEKGYHADFYDVRKDYGAVSTIMTEYLRAAGEAVGTKLATALLYGIRTDTALLSRGTSRSDVEAYAFLQEHADPALLARIDRPAYPRAVVPLFGLALENVQFSDELATVWMGGIPSEHAHMLPEIADLCLSIEGVSWVVASGVVDDLMVANIRHLEGSPPPAGDLARRLTRDIGSGGGHATMARIEIPLPDVPIEPGDLTADPSHQPEAAQRAAAWLLDWVRAELDALRSG